MTYLMKGLCPFVTLWITLAGCIVAMLLPTSAFGQTGTLGIRIIDNDGSGVPDLAIRLLPSNRIATTDALGEVVFTSVPIGEVAVTSIDPDWLIWEQTTLIDGDTTLEILAEQDLVLDEIAVTALRKGAEVSPSTTTWDRAKVLKEQSPRDIPYLLQDIPGVVAFSDAGAGVGYTGMRIRGSDQTRINITLNGIPINDAESQNVFFVNMPDLSSSLQSVQVQRGVGSSSNGAASFGASVNMSTHHVANRPGVQAEASVGSFDTYRGALHFQTGEVGKGFYLDGRASKITSDGYIDRASSDLTAIAFSPAIVKDDWSIRYDFIHGEERTYQAWYGIDRATLDVDRQYNPAGTEQPEEPYDDQVDDYQQTHHQLHLARTLSVSSQLGVSLHYTRGKGFFEEYKADESRTEYGYQPIMIGGESIDKTDLIRRRALDNHFYGAIANYQHRISPRDELVFGAGANHYIGDHFGEIIWAQFADGIPPSDRYYDNTADKYDAHAFAKYLWTIRPGTRWFFDLQYRYINYQFEGPLADGRLSDREEDYHFINPKIGLRHRLNHHMEVLAYTGIGQKEPNRDDFTASSPRSQPDREWLWDSELGLKWTKGDQRVGLTAYYMYYRDQLALTGEINDVGAATRTNVDRSYRLGLEFEGGAQLSRKWTIQGHAAWSRNRVDETTVFLDTYDEDFNFISQTPIEVRDAKLPYSPTWTAGVSTQYALQSTADGDEHDVNITIIGRYISRQQLDLTGDRANAIPDYGTIDVRLGYGRPISDRGGKWSLGLNLINVLDREYVANAWSYAYILDGLRVNDQGFFPQAPLHALVSLRLEL